MRLILGLANILAIALIPCTSPKKMDQTRQTNFDFNSPQSAREQLDSVATSTGSLCLPA